MDSLLKKDIECFNQIFSRLDAVQQQEYYVNFGYQFTHNSTAIEGNTLSYYEAVTLINDDITPSGKTLRECLEVKGHDMAFKRMMQLAFEKTPIDDDLVCELHKLCMFPAKYAGVYRTSNAYIQGARTKVSNPTQIYQDMRFFYQDLSERTFNDPVEKAAYTHAEFVRIHPFPDGNGRTSRLIMNLSLLNDDYPLICIKKELRAEYIETLDIYGVERDLKPFTDFLRKTMKKDLEQFFERHNELYKEISKQENAVNLNESTNTFKLK
jgi:Fic family protein